MIKVGVADTTFARVDMAKYVQSFAYLNHGEAFRDVVPKCAFDQEDHLFFKRKPLKDRDVLKQANSSESLRPFSYKKRNNF